MTSHSDDILDCMGFRRADVLPLLAAAGVCVDGALLAPTPAPVRKDWPDWKLRLAVADYLTDTEVSAALAGVDLSTPGWLSDDEQAELSSWEKIVTRACDSGSMKAVCADIDGGGNPSAWTVLLPNLAAWCASRNPPIPYPLPGDPAATMPTTDAGLRDALAASQKERAEWKAKAEALDRERKQCTKLQEEIDRLQGDLKAQADEVAALTVERDELRADALAGKSRTTALKIIGGMAASGYGMNIYAARLDGIGDMVKDLQRVGADTTEKTLREWIKESATVISPPSNNTPSTAKPA